GGEKPGKFLLRRREVRIKMKIISQSLKGYPMTHLHFSTSLILSSFWLVLSLFSLRAEAVNPPGSYGDAAIAAGDSHRSAQERRHRLGLWWNPAGVLGDGTNIGRATPFQDGTLNLQTFVFGSLPGLQAVNSGGGEN
ncbi:MAG: hypothetical protein RKR03_11210, partial [Candidatus Competibacter sp.]|nr:hypothetical protein [Candidatus Competibacter sp.]